MFLNYPINSLNSTNMEMKKRKGYFTFNKQSFVGRTEGNITDHYLIKKEIGKGSYGRVYEVEHKISNEIRACKHLSKINLKNNEKLNTEINILIKTDHPNIIKLYEVFEDPRYIFLLMEECTGGELFDRIAEKIKKKQPYTEKEAAHIFKQLMSAIAYCHTNNICHRDLKPENILYTSNSEKSLIKVIDFGLSAFSHGDFMKIRVGTAYYIAPEVIKGKYNEKCDIWSAGVILYILLSGSPPFNGPNDNEIYAKISRMKYSFPEKKWKNVSKEAIDLIKSMLCEEEKRPTAMKVLEHPWFTKVDTQPEKPLEDFDAQTLINYINVNRLKKLVLTFIATRLKDNEVEKSRKIFEGFDKNKDGTITFEEWKTGLILLNIVEEKKIVELFNSVDTDMSGRIDYTEFLAATMDQKLYLKEKRLYEAFKAFDKDNSGKITKSEIMNLLKLEEESNERIAELIKDIDTNGDGEIDYNEFLNMMISKQ